MNTTVTGNVIAGVIAFAIYLVISVATGSKAAPAIIGAVLLGLFTFVASYVITRIIASRHT
ncbi:MAG: hypothetical protein M3N98_00415 [Actinomycetota bacterium]|nr:hypothetical protein [Actinomycetota bacterium]